MPKTDIRVPAPVIANEDQPEFREPPKKRQFLGANQRCADGTSLFVKDGAEVDFECIGWEWFTPEGKEKQVGLILRDERGEEWFRPVNKTMEYAIRALGHKLVTDVIGKTLRFHMTDSKKEGAFRYVLSLVGVS